MKTIKTILVDDEPRGLSALQRLLEFNCPEIEIIGLCSSADEAKEKNIMMVLATEFPPMNPDASKVMQIDQECRPLVLSFISALRALSLAIEFVSIR